MPTSLPKGLLWGVGSVSRRLGIASGTLRTWDRRYGLSPSARTVGGHRRYSEADVARLARASQLIAEGVPPAQAALVAIGVDRGPAQTVAHPSSHEDVPLAPHGAPVTIDVLLRAAYTLDAPRLATVLTRVFDRRGVVGGWTDVVAPLLVYLGEEWVVGECGVEAEHLVSECVSTELRHRLRDGRFAASSDQPVLLAGADDDPHTLPLTALAVALSDRQIRTWMFGGSLPLDALWSAIERVSPAVVFLWSSLGGAAQLRGLAAAPTVTPEPVLLLGGPGWSPIRGAGGSASFEWVPDLQTAVDRISTAVA